MLVTYDGLITDKVLKLKEAAALVKANGIEIDVVVVDASPNKQSASKL